MNRCENYVSENNDGLKQCEEDASYLLIYYNKIEDMVKAFFHCNDCHSELTQQGIEYFKAPNSIIIDLNKMIGERI